MATKKKTGKIEASKTGENYKGKTVEVRIVGEKFVCECEEQRGNKVLLRINKGVTRWFNIKALKANYLRVIK